MGWGSTTAMRKPEQLEIKEYLGGRRCFFVGPLRGHLLVSSSGRDVGQVAHEGGVDQPPLSFDCLGLKYIQMNTREH